MYMVTMAARISHRVLDSEARNASAAPWKRLWMPSGRPIAAWTCSMRATASPSATPGARLNDTVTAGNWPMRLTCSAVARSSTRTRLASGTCTPSVPATWISRSAARP
ncbi:hypothetical protein D3C78_1215930 [compost metagenome]